MSKRYEINVAELLEDPVTKRSRFVHLFATHPRSLQSMTETFSLYARLRERFPLPQFKISVSEWEEKGGDFTDYFENCYTDSCTQQLKGAKS